MWDNLLWIFICIGVVGGIGLQSITQCDPKATWETSPTEPSRQCDP